MKKFYRILSLLLVVSMITVIPVLASDTVSGSPSYKIGIVADMGTKRTTAKSDNSTESYTRISSVEALNSEPEENISTFDLILIDDDDVEQLTAETIETLVYGGGVLGIQTNDADATLSSLYEVMGKEKNSTHVTNGVQQIGAFLLERDGDLVPGVISEAAASVSTPDGVAASLNPTKNMSMTEENVKSSLYDRIDVTDFLDNVFATKEHIAPTLMLNNDNNSVSLRSAPSNFDSESDDYVLYKCADIGGIQIGAAYITQYVYNICKFKDASDKKVYAIADVVSAIRVSSAEMAWVKYYNTQMHANISNMSIIDEAYITDPGTYSISLSGGVSKGSEVLSGNANAGVSYTFKSDDQKVKTDFLQPKIRRWNVSTTLNRASATWRLEPAIRVKNLQANTYKNGAYTSLQKVAFGWSFMGGEHGTEIVTTPFEVGQFWSF